MFRVVSYNVHQWVDCKGNENIENMIKTLKDMNGDIIGLQEVMFPHQIKNKTALEYLASELNFPYFEFHKEINHRGEEYGNALLSKFPFKIVTKKNIKGIAGLLIGDFDLSSLGIKEEIRVGLTHLDPADEELRVLQVQTAIPLLFNGNKEHLFLGDFNALKRDDYTDDYWKKLRKFNENNGWTSPKIETLKYLMKQDYEDCFTKCGMEGELLTCWTDNQVYRVDYILMSKEWKYKCKTCKRFDSYESDHFPVYADFEI
jgi:endonuclease/exonuclease/phosphatase family metal-dependent hydrolase